MRQRSSTWTKPPRSVQADAGGLEPEALALGATAHRDQHAVEALGAPALESASISEPVSRSAVTLRPEVDRREQLVHPALERLDEVAIHAGQQAVRHLDQR